MQLSTLAMPKTGETRVEIRVPESTKAKWEDEATERGLSLSAWIRDTLNTAMRIGRAERARLDREAEPPRTKR